MGHEVREAVPSVLRHLTSDSSATAVVAGGRDISYAELDRLVDEAAHLIGPVRALVAIEATNTLPALTAYLACLRRGHVALLLPPCTAAGIGSVHHPDVVVSGGRYTYHDVPPDRQLHPDLAVLLSTSGSTGSPRLVRLSRTNISSNAEAIAQALGLSAADRAITALSPAYSYGLSVINSHLCVGGSVVLTTESVTDHGFWADVRRHGVTALAGVPHTFELLDRIGFDGAAAPSLRLLTCAGGRLTPNLAVRFADLGDRHGFELVLMYGQTEATARIACLPGHLARRFPESVGWPIPGGSVYVTDADPGGVGRLVYRGPNVMMGYANDDSDLGRGAELTELDTGDRARIAADGRIEIRGRQDRFAKVLGYRIDLGDIDRCLERAGIRGAAVAIPDVLGVVVCDADPDRVSDIVGAGCGLPAAAIRVVCVPDLPRVAAGKPDAAALARMVTDARAVTSTPTTDPTSALTAAYSRLLRRPVNARDSFVALGGDSLTFVAVSLEVERILGHLPIQWQVLAISELAATTRRDSPREAGAGWRQMDSGVVLRAVAITVIVASHAGIMDVRGGAHLLVALLGFNLARFPLSDPDRRRRLRSLARHTGELLVPGVVWVAALAILTSTYSWGALGWNPITNPVTDNPDWRYWFVAAMVWIMPLTVALVAIPWVDELRRRHPFGFPLALTLAAWSAFVLWVPDARPSSLFAPLAVLWIFLLGWAAAQATDGYRRLAVSAVILVTVPISYEGSRAWTIPVLLLVMVWVSRIRLPQGAAIAAAVVAEASLYIFLSHWQVLDVVTGWWALCLSILLGVGIQQGVARVRVRWT